jgi:replicative superfamily II helicase
MDLFLRNKDNFKFILSTPSIVYGTNINLSIIDIDSSFVTDSTKNTLYQLIGRAGRRGRSNSATIIFRDNDMLNVIFKNEATNIEAENIERNYLKLLK